MAGSTPGASSAGEDLSSGDLSSTDLSSGGSSSAIDSYLDQLNSVVGSSGSSAVDSVLTLAADWLIGFAATIAAGTAVSALW